MCFVISAKCIAKDLHAQNMHLVSNHVIKTRLFFKETAHLHRKFLKLNNHVTDIPLIKREAEPFSGKSA